VGPEGLVVGLIGELGAGKTVFAKGLAEGLGVAEGAVASPTFVIAAELPTPRGLRFVHADLYRVGSEAELEGAGWLDWLGTGTLLVVEWADRLPRALPADRLEVRLSVQAGCAQERDLEARALGPGAEAVLRRWQALAGSAGVETARPAAGS
jgi:tRNA threonylcarbamoyladenosine biosynthesis protein TsaE